MLASNLHLAYINCEGSPLTTTRQSVKMTDVSLIPRYAARSVEEITRKGALPVAYPGLKVGRENTSKYIKVHEHISAINCQDSEGEQVFSV